MPRVPWQELLVAVAGPAVNVVIACVLGTALFFAGAMDDPFSQGTMVDNTGIAIVDSTSVVADGDAGTTPAMATEVAEREAAEMKDPYFLLKQPSVLNFARMLLIVNAALVLFNLIPAFPMDGGRVLRSVLAMLMNYRQATFVASRIGLVCAALMAALFFFGGQQNFTLILIPVFIAYAGLTEAKQVDVMETLRGLSVGDAMLANPPAVPMDMALNDVADNWKSLSVSALPVMSSVESVVGVLRLADVVKAIESATDKRTGEVDRSNLALLQTAGQLTDHGVPLVKPDEPLEDVVLGMARGIRQVPVVDNEGQLVGLLDLDHIRARAPLSKLKPKLEAETAPNDAEVFGSAQAGS